VAENEVSGLPPLPADLPTRLPRPQFSPPVPAGKGIVFELPHIKARVARLDELTRSLPKEIVVITDADDPLLYLERRAYLGALHRPTTDWRRPAACWRGR
jgi:hypothetical protein